MKSKIKLFFIKIINYIKEFFKSKKKLREEIKELSVYITELISKTDEFIDKFIKKVENKDDK